jgi:putative endonuclease
VKGGWVYILECAGGSCCTGAISHLRQRVWAHQAGMVDGYTCRRRPLNLLWSEWFDDIRFAIAAERQIKGWNRKKKEALMMGDFEMLRELSKSHAALRIELSHRRGSIPRGSRWDKLTMTVGPSDVILDHGFARQHAN